MAYGKFDSFCLLSDLSAAFKQGHFYSVLPCHACLIKRHSSNCLCFPVTMAWLESAETLAASVFSGNSHLVLILSCGVLKLYLAEALFWCRAYHLGVWDKQHSYSTSQVVSLVLAVRLTHARLSFLFISFWNCHYVWYTDVHLTQYLIEEVEEMSLVLFKEAATFMRVIPPLACSWKTLFASSTNTLVHCRARVYWAVALDARLTLRWCTEVFLLRQIQPTVCGLWVSIPLRHGRCKVWALPHVCCLFTHLFVFVVN